MAPRIKRPAKIILNFRIIFPSLCRCLCGRPVSTRARGSQSKGDHYALSPIWRFEVSPRTAILTSTPQTCGMVACIAGKRRESYTFLSVSESSTVGLKRALRVAAVSSDLLRANRRRCVPYILTARKYCKSPRGA